MTMTKLPAGCSGGLMGVAVPVDSWTADAGGKATSLGGSGRAAMVLTPPTVDAAEYTPAAALTAGPNDVEGGHHAAPTEAGTNMAEVAALSAQERWAARRTNPFSNLLDVVRGWLSDLVPAPTLESAWVLAGAQACDLGVPVVLQMSATDPTVKGPPKEKVASNPTTTTTQGDRQKSTPTPWRIGKSVPPWRIVFAKHAGRW